MTTPADRFQHWIESLSNAWGKTLGAWSAGFIFAGLEQLFDIIGRKASEELAPTIAKLEEHEIPPELKPIIDEIKTPTGEISALSGLGLLNRVVGSIKGDVFAYLTRAITRGFSYSADFYLPDPSLLLDYYLRHIMPDKNTLYSKMRDHGIPPEETDKLLEAKYVRFPSEIVGQLVQRDREKYNKLWDDVSQLGVDTEHINALKELSYRVPGSGDVIRYMVKEVYNPSVYKAFGQDQEFPGGPTDFSASALKDAESAGVRREHLLKEWIAHWNLPGSSQGFDLLHRGEITESELGNLLKALDIMPFWRDKLTALSWDVPNRVELRMLARYGLVDRDFIIDALKNAGLREDYRPILADLMLAQGLLSDMSKRYTNKWINSDELRSELVDTGMDAKVQDRIYTWIIKNNGGDRLANEKNLTAAEIIKGVKQMVLTYDEGLAQLISLGYDEAEAAYKIAIDTEIVKDEAPADLTVRIDTIRRQRRQRIIDRSGEISQLLALQIDPDVAEAYADNDDLRLVKIKEVTAAGELLEYQTDDGKVNVETVRLSRRQRRIGRLEEITALLDLQMSDELAVAYADNDDLRLVKQTE